jgi:8-hydroxy-5-deazaflavin:NADPH oxidoreductase
MGREPLKIGILGTGIVGQTLAAKLAADGHEVVIGTRDVEAALARTEAPWPGMLSFSEWHAANPAVVVGTFADAAAQGEIVLIATTGTTAVDVAGSVAEHLESKILIDISNPLDFSGGFPPSLSVVNTDSLGEQVQRALPDTKVVKTLNTVNALVMVDPGSVAGGDHHLFVSGDDAGAKAEVSRLLGEWFGWTNVMDLGDITTARGTEMYLALWVRMIGVLGTPNFNIKIVR